MIKKIINKIINETLKCKSFLMSFFKSKYSLIILDDFYPHLHSGFRVAEYNYYLNTIKDSVVLSTGSSFRLINSTNSFKEVKKKFEFYYPNESRKVFKFYGNRLKTKLVYTVFLNNIHSFLPIINKSKINFFFTLYPGGGFRLGETESDEKLKDVFRSEYFKKVIVTTKPTYDYLINNKFCDQKDIEFIYGVVCASDLLNNKKQIHNTHLEKTILNICFVAHKYTDQGKDKGYDVFIKVCKQLNRFNLLFKFHVVGNFNEMDIDVKELKGNLVFYSTLNTQDFPLFYCGMDIILSPNSSFVLSKGAFDGFPTGACIEAGLNGVALFLTDDLNQNIKFNNDEEIVIITKKETEIVEKILLYYHDREKLKQLAINGQKKIIEVYNLEAQMKQRMDVVRNLMNV